MTTRPVLPPYPPQPPPRPPRPNPPHPDQRHPGPPPVPPRPGPAPADPEPAAPETGPIPRALEILGSIVAPTTLLTALLFYFGLLYAVGYYRYFGVNFTVLDLPAQGFLILSASTAVLPLVLTAIGTLVALGVYRLPLDRLTSLPRQLARRAVLPTVGLAGLSLVVLAAIDALFGVSVFPPAFWEARGLSLAVGVLVLGYAGRMHRLLTPRPSPGPAPGMVAVARWGSLFLLIAIGLFWAVGSYAIRVGEEGARGLAADLGCAADVVLYSEKSLNLQSAGVPEERSADPDSAYGFRYPALKLIPQTGDQYLLLPAGWTPANHPAIILARTDTVRLEFVTTNC